MTLNLRSQDRVRKAVQYGAGTVRAVVVPSEYEDVIHAEAWRREEQLLRAVWQEGYARAQRLEVAWCVPSDVRRLQRIQAWRDERARDPAFMLRRFPRDDFLPLVGAEVMAARRAADLVIVWSHSRELWSDISARGSGLAPVVLVGLPVGTYLVTKHGEERREVVRHAPRHFCRGGTVQEVVWWRP